jgi:hypothetical protein
MRLLIAFGIAAIAFNGLMAEPVSDTNFFPIMPWNSPPNDPAVLKKIRECGFTLAGFVAPSALDACAAAGLRPSSRTRAPHNTIGPRLTKPKQGAMSPISSRKSEIIQQYLAINFAMNPQSAARSPAHFSL